MKNKTEYAVISFLEQRGQCYPVHDLVSGYSFMQLATMGTYAKRRVFDWIYQFITCLEQSNKCKEGLLQEYINPYTVIISRENKVYFLDPIDQENAELFEKLRKHAKKGNNSFKMFRFILERCIDKRELTYREEKIIERMKSQYGNMPCPGKKWEKIKSNLYVLVK